MLAEGDDDRIVGPGDHEPRRRAREAALQILYQWEVGLAPIEEAVETYWLFEAGTPDPRVRELAAGLARGTVERVEAIDRLVAASAEHWRVARMAVVDRLVLRLAVNEFLDPAATPPPVVINEALELARTFGGEHSVSFVNGVLDAVKRRLEEEAAGGRDDGPARGRGPEGGGETEGPEGSDASGT